MRPEDEAEFTAFVRSDGARLLRAACLLTADRQSGEDLLQTVLAKLARHWSRIDRGAERAWTARVLATTSVDRARRRRWREISRDVLPERASSDGLGMVVERDVLLRALARLPPRQRAVLVLRYFLDLSERQVAEHLGIAEGTVKSQASRGLSALRALLPANEEI